jgi:hypothetical protein
MYAWHCSALKRWCKWESTGIAENLLVLCNRFCNWEILTCSGHFYAPTNREKLSDDLLESNITVEWLFDLFILNYKSHASHIPHPFGTS